MDLSKALASLYEERKKVEEAIAVLEALSSDSSLVRNGGSRQPSSPAAEEREKAAPPAKAKRPVVKTAASRQEG